MRTNNSIDLQRIERRYLLPKVEVPSFIEDISNYLKPITFSENKISQTIYLNNDDLSIPWGIVFRARKYIKRENRLKKINPNEKFLCEIKKESTPGSEHREKSRREMSLLELVRLAKEKLQIELRPLIITQYKREHFISNDGEIRVTLDTKVRYGYITKENEIIWLKNEENARIELKVSQKIEDSGEFKDLRKAINSYSMTPIFSKKDQAYYFLREYLKAKYQPKEINEIEGLEIESKLSIENAGTKGFYVELKRAFLDNEIKGFSLSDYPWSEASSNANHYWDSVENIRVNYKSQGFKIIQKFEPKVEKDKYNLNCIIIRREVKSKVFKHNTKNLNKILMKYNLSDKPYIGYAIRSKVSFIPKSMSDRFYKIYFDRTKFRGNLLFQIEIEYSGRKVGKWKKTINAEKEIIDELSELTKEILNFAKKRGYEIKPSNLRRFDWVKDNLKTLNTV